ncbi:hypothetical protein I4U23_017303 [Adineta vaga]|nr:hypothetical protein I4U23_017303 [Adineta vaga]
MESFAYQFNRAIDLESMGAVRRKDVLVTRSGRKVAFVVTSLVWYALRVYVENEDGDRAVQLARTQHLTLAGVMDQKRIFIRDL